MEELERFVERARAGDLDAYGQIVGRFQDMAYGCAYAVVGDFHLAQDVAQEAFLEAYRSLDKLQQAKAFPGWFRRIVLRSCNRLTRRRQPDAVGVETLTAMASASPDPAREADTQEMKDKVLAAIRALPEHERMVTTLFYVNGYSQEEIAGFLEVPVTTVKNRLYTSRKRLKERMMNMVADEMKSHPLPEKFPERIRLLLELPRPLEIEGHPVQRLWREIRGLLPEMAVVELDEVCDKSLSVLRPEQLEKHVFHIDAQRMLRPEFTSQMLDLWLRKGGPVRWITAGRLFRPAKPETGRLLQVFHQAEVLWAGEGFDDRRCAELVLGLAAKLLPGVQLREGEPYGFRGVPHCRNFEALWEGQWRDIGGGGAVSEELLIKAHLDPKRSGVVSFALGLERTAQIRYNIADARKLWQPPYVAK